MSLFASPRALFALAAMAVPFGLLAACLSSSSSPTPTSPGVDGGSTPTPPNGADGGTVMQDATVDARNADAGSDAAPEASCASSVPLVFDDGGMFTVPSPYLDETDSPFACRAFAYFHRGTFEGDGGLPPGVTADLGALAYPPGTLNGLTDSVDGDDGVRDGGVDGATYPCERCNSWFNGSGSTGVSFTFNETTLGALPTHVGLVWTDGPPSTAVTFTAYGIDGGVVGSQTTNGIGDGTNYGTTAEDRFFGVVFTGGVKAVKMQGAGGGGIEVDHLQYGRAP